VFPSVHQWFQDEANLRRLLVARNIDGPAIARGSAGSRELTWLRLAYLPTVADGGPERLILEW
jgi:hypothetical protein